MAAEGETACVPAGSVVRYGVEPNWLESRLRLGGEPRWVERTISSGGRFAVTNEFFGCDPAPGVRKKLQRWQT